MQKSAITLWLLFMLLLYSAQSNAQQIQKASKQNIPRRDEKMKMSSPGDVSLKTYTRLQKSEMITRGNSPAKRYAKPGKDMYPAKRLKRLNY